MHLFARVNTLVSTEPESSSDSLAGMCAGPWRIEYELGRGGMGVVYAVEHVHIGKRAALKVLHRRMPDPERHAQRMMLEARVVNAIAHPNIVDVFDVGTTHDGQPYIVMERLEGSPLSDIFISQRRAMEILVEVCAALAAAHDAGVVHRDLKPENIFVGEQAVTVLDWGIARLMSAEQTIAVGQIVGTPQYLSPEQARGEDVSPASDVYALGVVAYELFAGEVPFLAMTTAEVMAMHLHMEPPTPDLGDPRLEQLLLEMLAKDPADRPTIREVGRRLTACLADDDDTPLDLPRRRRWPALAGAIALAGSAAAFTMRDTHSAQASIEIGRDGSFVDDDGTRYLFHKRGPNMISVDLAGRTTDVLQANLAWEHGTVETPWVTKHDGYYYLFYRAADVVGVARATSPLGPFDKLTQPITATSSPLTFVNGWPRAAHRP